MPETIGVSKMLKKYISLFSCMFLVFAFIGGCTKKQNSKIAADVFSMDKPVRSREDFHPNISIDDILKKYIYVGMPEKEAVTFLESDGFSVYEEDAQKPAQRNLRAIYYVYTKAPIYTLPIIMSTVVVLISIEDGKVSEFSGIFGIK